MFTLLIYQIDDDNKTTLEHQNYFVWSRSDRGHLTGSYLATS